jgi:hypothetical protein
LVVPAWLPLVLIAQPGAIGGSSGTRRMLLDGHGALNRLAASALCASLPPSAPLAQSRLHAQPDPDSPPLTTPTSEQRVSCDVRKVAAVGVHRVAALFWKRALLASGALGIRPRRVGQLRAASRRATAGRLALPRRKFLKKRKENGGIESETLI